jgi:GNAT superfamily N-acetyltransferase
VGPSNVWNDAFVVRVRVYRPGDLDACLSIVRGLPEFFTAEAVEAIRDDLGRHGGWVADAGEVVGLAVVERRSVAVAEMLWTAVHRDRRGSGIGTRLIEQVLGALAGEGVVLVEVKTLDGSAGYGPYASTRAFWERRGFVQVDRIDPMPGWQPGSPCALYVAALGTTRSKLG